MNNLSIKNKTILLFGCTGVLGFEFVKYLLLCGCNIIIADKNKKKLDKICKEFNIKGYVIDANNEKSIEKNIKKIGNNHKKKIDCAIYNVAITSEYLKKTKINREFTSYQLKNWKKTISVNLTGSFIFAREIGKIFYKQKYGNLINISSIYGILSPDHSIYDKEEFYSYPDYAASKSGIIGLSKWLSTLWASKNIRVNCISPGGIFNNHSKNFKRLYSKRIPMKRMGNKKEINGILHYLISDESSYCTGQNFTIDGGLSTW